MGQAKAYLLEAIRQHSGADTPLLIALDGRCAAGKTTLALQVQAATGCNVLHMDDFFLRPRQRTPERLAQSGGNVDWERFQAEVLLPLKRGGPFSFRPYDCHTQALKGPLLVKPKPVTLVEGSYSCHPRLWDFYDLHIFLTVDPREQLRRIRRRNGAEALAVFQTKWIPMEERYFQDFDLQNRCDAVFGGPPAEVDAVP